MNYFIIINWKEANLTFDLFLISNILIFSLHCYM